MEQQYENWSFNKNIISRKNYSRRRSSKARARKFDRTRIVTQSY